ncbi:MAG: hypothetical protein NVS3B20_10720 [Polyangiales bacterium]
MVHVSRVLLPILALIVSCSQSQPASPGTACAGANTVTPDNATWCAASDTCCNAVSICGACVAQPSTDLKRTTDTREFAGPGAPDTACLAKGAEPKALAPKSPPTLVTMRGHARIFANGPDSKNVKIEVFKEGLNGALGDSIGATVTDGTLPLGTLTEPISNGGTPQERVLDPLELKGVPTETVLIIKTSGKSPEDNWFNLYEYGVAALDANVSAGVYSFDVRALGNDDYSSILKAAYNRPPEGGKSALAGEGHDCLDVRLSNATVQVQPKSSFSLFYLTDVEDDPLPDRGRTATGRLGLYAVGGLTPASYTVSSAGKLGNQVMALGSYVVQTFPDSVTILTFRGRRAWQSTIKK